MPPQTKQTSLQVETIKQYAGPVTVKRRVPVNVPGKFFGQALSAADQKLDYVGEPVEFQERKKFEQHSKGWGAAHTGPGIRVVCNSDAIEDPENKGFWTTLPLFNRWRHETYKNDRTAELQYLDELPAVVAPALSSTAAKGKGPPAVKEYFTLCDTVSHTYGGNGNLAGKTVNAFMFACKLEGCSRGSCKPIKQVGSGTGQLFVHLESCQPEVALRLRAASQYSPVMLDDNGTSYRLYSFAELLPSHALFVQKCFRGFDHFYETRADNGLIEWVRSFEKRAALPHRETCNNLLDVFEELADERVMKIISAMDARFGRPNCGEQSDLWSMKSCRATFGCLRGSWTIPGDILAALFGFNELKGRLVDCSPILSFEEFMESRHTGAALARWKGRVADAWQMQDSSSLATEDGASNNRKANAILGRDQKICLPHDIARAVLYAAGEEGKPSQNGLLKIHTARASKQSSSFSRSVVNRSRLEQAQVDAGTNAARTLTTRVKNKTRWLGLWEMCNHNRRIAPEICLALTGDPNGYCAEREATDKPAAAPTIDSESSGSDESDSDDDREEAGRAAKKDYPMAHRCLDATERQHNDIFESLLDRPREITILCQDNPQGYGEGMDLGEAFVSVEAMRDEAIADRVELVSGRGDSEVWTQVAAKSLPPMFQTFRKVLSEQLTKRYNLDTTPDRQTLLALKMHPAINT